MKNDFESSSRSNYRAKRKKTNFILNGLIVIILLLIAFVAYSIFSSGNNKASTKKNEQKTEVKQSLHKDKSDKKDQEAISSNSEGSNAASDETSQSGDSSAGNTDESQAVSTEDDSSETSKTIENPDWKPAGTTQTGEHTANYDSSSTDWQEMLNAISSATGLDQSNMTVWFLGRDKSASNGSVGTVSSKDKQQKYRVYIQWVDGQGWKPTKVEELSVISNGN